MVYRGQIDALIAAQRFREYEKPLNSDTSFWGNLAGWARGSFTKESQYRDYIAMLRQMPRYFDQQIANMRAGLARGFTVPRVTLKGRDIGVAQVVDAGTSDAQPFMSRSRPCPPPWLRDRCEAAGRGQGGDPRRRGACAPAAAELPAQRLYPHAQASTAAYDLPTARPSIAPRSGNM